MVFLSELAGQKVEELSKSMGCTFLESKTKMKHFKTEANNFVLEKCPKK